MGRVMFFKNLPIGAFFSPEFASPTEVYSKLDKDCAVIPWDEPISNIESLFIKFEQYECVIFLGVNPSYD